MKTRRHRTAVLSTLIAALSTSSPCLAQTDAAPFRDLGRYIKDGSRIVLVGREAGEVRGTVESLTPSSLVLTVDGSAREFTADTVGWIEAPVPILRTTLAVAAAVYAVAVGFPALECRCNTLTDPLWQVLALTTTGVVAATSLVQLSATRPTTVVYGTRPGSSAMQFRRPSPVRSVGDLWSRLRPGDRITVRDAAGREASGKFLRASNVSIALLIDGAPQQVPASSVQRVSRRTRPVGWNALLWSAAGITYGALHAGRNYEPKNAAPMWGAAGFVIGTAVGYAWPHQTIVYGGGAPATVRIEPMAAPGGRGVALSVRF